MLSWQPRTGAVRPRIEPRHILSILSIALLLGFQAQLLVVKPAVGAAATANCAKLATPTPFVSLNLGVVREIPIIIENCGQLPLSGMQIGRYDRQMGIVSGPAYTDLPSLQSNETGTIRVPVTGLEPGTVELLFELVLILPGCDEGHAECEFRIGQRLWVIVAVT